MNMNQPFEYIMMVFMMSVAGKMIKGITGDTKKPSSSKALVPYKSVYYQTLVAKATPMMTGPEEPYNTEIGKPEREVIYIPVKKPAEVPVTRPVEEPVRVPAKVS